MGYRESPCTTSSANERQKKKPSEQKRAGKYGRVPALPFKLYNRNEKDIMSFIDETILYLLNLDNVLDSQTDTDLLNIRDEMVAEFNKLRYLITLK